MKKIILLMTLAANTVFAAGYQATEVSVPASGIRCVFRTEYFRQIELNTGDLGADRNEVRIDNRDSEVLKLKVTDQRDGAISIEADLGGRVTSVSDVRVWEAPASVFNPEDESKTIAKKVFEITNVGRLFCVSAKSK